MIKNDKIIVNYISHHADSLIKDMAKADSEKISKL